MEFEKTFDLFMEDIIQSVTPEELEERQKEYGKIQIKAIFELLFKENKMVKNADGTYDVKYVIQLSELMLTSLTELPYRLNNIYGYFLCSLNKLTDLKGCPKKIYNTFTCQNNYLTNLIGGPEYVKGDYYCHHNNLTSLEGCPNIIYGDLICDDNNILTTKGFPTIIERDLRINKLKNGKMFPIEEIRKVCNVKGKII